MSESGYSLGLVMLYARDLPRIQAFYTDVLGLEVVPEFSGPRFTFLRLDSGTPIALQDVVDLPHGLPAIPGGCELGLMVADVDATYRAWRERGVEMLSEIADNGAGRFFRARDPEGHILSVMQPHPALRAMRQRRGIDAPTSDR